MGRQRGRPASWDADLPDPPRREFPAGGTLLSFLEVPRIPYRERLSTRLSAHTPEAEIHPYYGAPDTSEEREELGILKLLEQLPELERKAVELCDIEGLSLSNVAEQLGFRHKTQAMRARNRGRDQLRELICNTHKEWEDQWDN